MRASASALQRIETCPASAVLPQVGSVSEEADGGSALHEHIQLRAELGVDDAVAKLDETLARWDISEREAGFLKSRLLKFEWSPPAGSICEIRLGLFDDESGAWTVRRVPAEDRFYKGAVFTGQFDVMWSETEPLVVNEDGSVHCPANSTLWVLDLKGGQDRYVPTIERNLQVATYAYLAAKWTGAKRVVPAILYPGPGDGDWDVPGEMWGPKDLDAVEARLRSVFRRVAAQEAALAAGEPLELTEGRHCDFCPAVTRCPAKIALFKSILNDTAPPLPTIPLTPEESGRLVSLHSLLGSVIARLRRTMEAQVQEHGPIPLEDGLVWGPEVSSRTKILSQPAREVLSAELGEYAEQAFNMDVSGSSIERAVKEKLLAIGKTRGVAPAVRGIYAKLGEAGALEQKTHTEWKVHRPKKAAPPELQDVEDLGEAI